MIVRGTNGWRGPRAGLLLAACLLAGGCQRQETGEVNATVIGERLPRLADPAAGMSVADQLLIVNTAQGLVRFDAAGDIAPGLAERWAVSDDGLSYVFRLRAATWSDGRKVRARDIVRLMQRQLARRARNPLSDTLGAVREVVPMTDRVIAVELNAPRPHLLQLLAQPEFGLVRERSGTGPFTARRDGDALVLERSLPVLDGNDPQKEQVRLKVAKVQQALADFVAGETELVLGGTVGDVPTAQGARLPRGALHFDPVAGLFGLVPARAEGPAADRTLRELLDRAIDRQALVAALNVAGLQPRVSLLQPGMDGISAYQPEWARLDPAQRQIDFDARVEAVAREPAEERPLLRIAVPDGPGGEIILARLKSDWEKLGMTVEKAGPDAPADFQFIEEVAPSSSPAWFLRRFRCDYVPVCSTEADQLLDAARLTGFPPQRAQFFAEAERIMREEVLFMPVAAPVRWSLVGRGVTGFAGNRFARHTLTDLRTARSARN